MNAKAYQIQATQTSQINWEDNNAVDILILGMVGEVGSLASVFKKKLRDASAYLNHQEHALEEVGDILWYVTTAAIRLKVQIETWPTINSKTEDIFQSLYLLNKNVTEFCKEKNVLINPEGYNQNKASNLIKEILLDLANISSFFGSDLSRVSQQNSIKTHSYWRGTDNLSAKQFDSDFPWYEQLPRKFTVTFLGVKDDKTLILIMNGRQLGDRLTDNSYQDDGYRFHDIFHIAGVATLGWSPVFRDLLLVKRKSDPQIDEIEDGARAAIVEEAVINHIYDYARPNFLEGMERVELDLIKRIRNLVRGYEVSNCEPWEWNDCIIKSYNMFRLLMKHKGGRIEVDADTKSMTFHQLSDEPE